MFDKTLASVWFDECDPWKIFKKVKAINTASQLTENDCLVLWGGEDIGTELYGEQPNKYADNYEASYRDLVEINCINKAIALEIPIIGVCRGAQLLCAHQKGKLIQHVTNHCNKHKLYLPKENRLFETNSYHHQTMVPTEDAEIIAISANKHDVGWTENNIKIKIEVPEIVKWPKIRALGIQGHPEYADAPKELINYTRKLILNL
jgi:putative glutamine amidotransferase